MGVAVGVGVGVGGAANVLTSMILFSVPEFSAPEVPNKKSPVIGSTVTPSGPLSPEIKTCCRATSGSPAASKGTVMIVLLVYFAIRALFGGKAGARGGTKAMPSAPATFARRVVLVMLN